ncbi:hypothetical protein K474DRAFT_1713125 [Panus rudis PR-1116 ss-1]|nr:hypothetical protein K474DRAFT_1713125 [Panus rudis PR-1116 ss-1]
MNVSVHHIAILPSGWKLRSKQLYNDLLEAIKLGTAQSTVQAGCPQSITQPEVADLHPENVKYWRENDWKVVVSTKRKNKAIATAVGGQLKGKRGKSRSSKGENVSLPFMEDRDGNMVDGFVASAMRKHARSIWIHIRDSPDYVTPSRWGEASEKVKDYYYTAMKRRFPEFGLCELDWKAEWLATGNYPHFYSRYVATRSGNPDDSSSNDGSDEEETISAGMPPPSALSTHTSTAAPVTEQELQPASGGTSTPRTTSAAAQDFSNQFEICDPFTNLFSTASMAHGTTVTTSLNQTSEANLHTRQGDNPPEPNPGTTHASAVSFQAAFNEASASSTINSSGSPVDPSNCASESGQSDLRPLSRVQSTSLTPNVQPISVTSTGGGKRKRKASDPLAAGPVSRTKVVRKYRAVRSTKNVVTAMSLAREEWEAAHSAANESPNLDPGSREAEFDAYWKKLTQIEKNKFKSDAAKQNRALAKSILDAAAATK